MPLETCETMNDSWGFNITDRNYKSAKQLIQYMVNAAGRNANFLLNVGPKPDGNIQQQFVDTLKAIGDWMNKNGETIYSKTVSAAISCGANEKVVLYPNPLKSHLTVVLPATFNNGIIRISDAIGKPQIVKAITAGSNIINTQILLPG
eukprot:gene67676-92695_t